LLGLARDEAPAMRESCEQALRSWSQRGFHFQHLSALFTLSVGDLYEGAYARADERIEKAWPELETSFLLRVGFVRADAWYLRGRAAFAASLADKSRAPRASKVLRQAIRLVDRDGASWTRAIGLVLRAGLAQLAADADSAAALLERASEAFAKSEMRLHAAACEHQAARLRGADSTRTADALRGEGVQVPHRFAGALAPLDPALLRAG
jgi:hypothetical protein